MALLPRPVFLLPQAVTYAAERSPDHEAIRFQSHALTYEELEHRSNSLARVLIEEGVVRGDRVGIYMHKSLESAIALYGIMKAGAVYVPLDPLAPHARLQHVIRDCDIRCLVTKEAKREPLREILATQTSVEFLIGLEAQDGWPVRTVTWDEVFSVPSESVPDVGTIEDDLAYILYTSGSTGNPKGIMHTHRSGLSFAVWAAETYSLASTDRLSNHAPLHFDLSTFDFFAGALAGATTTIIPEALTNFPSNVARLIEGERLSIWYSVPYALIQLVTRGGIESRDLSSLRWVLFAGEPFPTKHLRELMARLPDARFSNLYGPTETNVCTYYHVLPLAEESDEPIPIGRVCENAEGVVVDADDQLVEPGGTGELLIRGPLVMRGYWGRPDLTEQGLSHRQLFPHYREVFYRTGDLVQLDPSGNYRYLGRRDRQIKTRGYRVELDEIEVALLAHDLVEEAAVFPVPDGKGSNLIEVAVTTKESIPLDVTDLFEHLASRLPPYAVPAKITVVADFPRTSTGKVDRRALQTHALESVNGGPHQAMPAP
jgi:amino acid adenylation domain-containing protein